MATAKVEIMGGANVALLGYSVVTMTLNEDLTSATNISLPTGFHAKCFLPCMDDSATIKRKETKVEEVTTYDDTIVTVTGKKGDLFLIIGQN